MPSDPFLDLPEFSTASVDTAVSDDPFADLPEMTQTLAGEESLSLRQEAIDIATIIKKVAADPSSATIHDMDEIDRLGATTGSGLHHGENTAFDEAQREGLFTPEDLEAFGNATADTSVLPRGGPSTEERPTSVPLRELAGTPPDTAELKAPEEFDPDSIENVLTQAGRNVAASVVRTFGSFGTMVEAQAVQMEHKDKAFEAAAKIEDPKLRRQAQFQIMEKDFRDKTEGVESTIIMKAMRIPQEAVNMVTGGLVRIVGPETAKKLVRNNREFLEDIEANIKGVLTNDEIREYAILSDRVATGRRLIQTPDGLVSGPIGSTPMTPKEDAFDRARLAELVEKRSRLPEEMTQKWQESASWKDKVTSADWWLLNGAEQAGPMAGFYITLRMGMRGANALAQARAFGDKTLKAIGAVSGASAGATASATIEGAAYYAQRIKEVPELQAAEETAQVARTAYEITFATSGLAHGLAGVDKSALSIAGAVISEPTEESLQQISGNSVSGRPLFEGVDDAFLLSIPFALFGGVQTVRGIRKDRAQVELEILQDRAARSWDEVRRRALEDTAEGEAEARRESVARIQEQRRGYAERNEELLSKFDEQDLETAKEEVEHRIQQHTSRTAAKADAATRQRQGPGSIGHAAFPGGVEGTDLRLQNEIDDITGVTLPAPWLQNSTSIQPGEAPATTTREEALAEQSELSNVGEDATFLERQRASGLRDPSREQRRDAAEGALSPLARREAEQRVFDTIFSLDRGSDYHVQLMRNAVDSGLATKEEALATDAANLEAMLATNTKTLEMPAAPLEDLREKNIAKKKPGLSAVLPTAEPVAKKKQTGLSAVLPSAEDTARRRAAGPPTIEDFLDKSPKDIAEDTTKSSLIGTAQSFGIDIKAKTKLSKVQIAQQIADKVAAKAKSDTEGAVFELNKKKKAAESTKKGKKAAKEALMAQPLDKLATTPREELSQLTKNQLSTKLHENDDPRTVPEATILRDVEMFTKNEIIDMIHRRNRAADEGLTSPNLPFVSETAAPAATGPRLATDIVSTDPSKMIFTRDARTALEDESGPTDAQIQGEEKAQMEAAWDQFSSSNTQEDANEALSQLSNEEILDFLDRVQAGPQSDNAILNKAMNDAMLDPAREEAGEESATTATTDELGRLAGIGSSVDAVKEYLRSVDNTDLREAAEDMGVAVKTSKGNFRSRDTLINQIADAVMKERRAVEIAESNKQGSTAPEQFWNELGDLAGNTERTSVIGYDLTLEQGTLSSGEKVYWTHDNTYDTVEFVPAEEAQELQAENARGNLGPTVEHLLNVGDEEFGKTFNSANTLWKLKLADQMGIAQMTGKGTRRKDTAINKDLKKELQAQRGAALPDLNPTKQEQNLDGVLAGPTRAAAPIIKSGVTETGIGLTNAVNEISAMATHQTGDPVASHAQAGRILTRLRDLMGFEPSKLGLKVRAEVDANKPKNKTGSTAMSDLRKQFAGLAEAYRVTNPINKVTRLARAMGAAFEGPNFTDMNQALSGLENIHNRGVDAWAEAVGEVNNLSSLPDDQNLKAQEERIGEDKTAAIASLRDEIKLMKDAGVDPTDPARVSLQDEIRKILLSQEKGGVTMQMNLFPVKEVYDLFKSVFSPLRVTKVDAEKYPAWARGRRVRETGIEMEMSYAESVTRLMDQGTFATQLVGDFEFPSLKKLVTSPRAGGRQLLNSTIMRTVNEIRALTFMVGHYEEVTGEKLDTLKNPESLVILSRGAPGKGEEFAKVWSEAVISSGTGRKLGKDGIARFTDYIFFMSAIRREAAALDRFNRYQGLKLENERLTKGLRTTRGKIQSLGKKGRKAKTDAEKTKIRNEKALHAELLSGAEAELAQVGRQMTGLKDRLISTDSFDATQINPDGYTGPEAREALAGMRDNLGDETMERFEAAAKKVNDVWGSLLDYSVEAGLISAEDARHMSAAEDVNGDYLGPFNVVTKWANGGLDEMHKGNLTMMGQDVYKTEKGTTDFIGDMGNASIDRIFKTVGFAERNRAVRELWTLVNSADAPETIKSLVKLPEGPEALSVIEDHGRWHVIRSDGKNIRGNPKSGHLTQAAAEKQMAAAKAKAGEGLQAPDGFESLYFLDDGKMQRIWAAQPIAYAVKGMNKPMVNWMMRAVNQSNQMLRMGATALNLTFTVVNVPRDLMTQYLAADNPLRWYNPVDMWIFAESWAQMLLPNGLRNRNTKALIKAWKDHGGSFSAQMTQIKPQKRALEMIGSFGAKATTLNNASDVSRILFSPLKVTLDGLTHFAEAAEGATRMGLFKKELRVAGAKKKGILGQGTTTEGVSPEAFATAALASRTGTIDFAQGGAFFQGMNYFAPFINAAAQGGRVMINGAAKNPLRASVWAAIGLAAVTQALTNDYEEYGAEMVNKIDPRVRKKNFIKILGTYQEDGETLPYFFTFPKGDFLALVTAPVESFIADGYSGEGAPAVRRGATDTGVESKNLGGFSLEEANKKTSIGDRLSETLLSTVSDVSPIEFMRDGDFTPELALATPLPVIPKGLIEVGYNKNFFFNSEIESSREMDRLPQERFRASTSLGARHMSKWLAFTFGEDSYLGQYSPLQIEHVARTFAAEAGKVVLRAPEALGILEDEHFSQADRVKSPIPFLGAGVSAAAADSVKWRYPWVESAFKAVGIEDEEIIALSRTSMFRAFFSTANRNTDQRLFAAHEKGSQIVQSREFLQSLDVRKLIGDAKTMDPAQVREQTSEYTPRQNAILNDELDKARNPINLPRNAKYRGLKAASVENMEKATMMATAMKDVLHSNQARSDYYYDLIKMGVITKDNNHVLDGQLRALHLAGYFDGRPFWMDKDVKK